MLNVLKSMYQNVKMQVKNMNSLSQFFESNIGLFQGETTSPIMFSLFLNDIEQSFQLNLHGLTRPTKYFSFDVCRRYRATV